MPNNQIKVDDIQWDDTPQLGGIQWDEPEKEKSYLEILAEKLRPRKATTVTPSPYAGGARLLEIAMKAVQVPQHALTALHSVDKYGKPLEPTYKERFEAEHSPSEVLPQLPQVLNLPPVEMQGLIQDIAYDPLILPAGKMLKGTKVAEKFLSGLSDISKLPKLAKTEDAIAFGKLITGKDDVIRLIEKKEAELIKQIKGSKEFPEKLIHERAMLREAREVATNKGGMAEIDDLEKAFADFDAKKIDEEPIDMLQLAKKKTEQGNLVSAQKAKEALRKSFSEGEAVKTPEVNAQKVREMYDKNWQALEENSKKTWKQKYKAAKERTVDVRAGVKDSLLKHSEEGRMAVANLDLVSGAHSKAAMDIEAASNKIYKGLDAAEERTLNEIIDSVRKDVIDSYKTGVKHTEGLKGSQHSDFLDSIPQDVKDKLMPKANEYFDTMKTQLDKQLDEGLINKAQYDELIKYDYSKREFIQYIDPEKTYNIGGKTITVRDSGIKSLGTGSEQYLELNSRKLMSDVISATEGRIFKNRANKALLKVAEQYPENGIIQLAKGKKPPGGFQEISAMVDGKKVDMWMPDEFAKGWIKSSPEISTQMANTVGWLSGSKLLKAMATGYNPEFLITNVPRDIAHIFLTTNEYSSVLPKFAGQIGLDTGTILKDAVLRKGRYVDYIKQGGGMEFLSHQGRLTKSKNLLGKVQSVFGYLGETSEIVTRLALRERALKNLAKAGKTGTEAEREATWIARNYLDFSQGGSWAKAADTAMPYLNAGIQGTRGIFRAAATNPAQFTWKASQVGTLAAGLYAANYYQNPEALKQVSKRDRANNFIYIMPGGGYKDKNGDKRYYYIRIPKDQGQRAIAAVFEGLMAKAVGDEDFDYNQIPMAVEDAMNITDINSLPPTMKGLLGYALNKDFWRMKDIWKGPEVPAGKERTIYTDPFFAEVGDVTGLSPERSKYALQQVFTSGNIYTSMAGYAWNSTVGTDDQAVNNLVTEEVILKQPFMRRLVKATNPRNEYQDYIKEIKKDVEGKRVDVRLGLDRKINDYLNDRSPESRQEVLSYIKQQPKLDRARLTRRFNDAKKIKENTPNKRYWLQLLGLNPEARAKVFYDKYKGLDKAGQDEMMKQARRIPGVKTKEFNKRFRILKKEDKEVD